MSEKKVVVPKEMLKYAINYTALPDGCGYDIVETILRRGLIYQSENPRVPTLEQWAECLTSIGLANNAILTEQMVPRKEIAAWIFRMYLAAPEPEYGVCKKCGARVQDGATKSHSSAAPSSPKSRRLSRWADLADRAENSRASRQREG